jgi:hypothetical protein
MKRLLLIVALSTSAGCAARNSFLGADPCFYPLHPETWGCADEVDTPVADGDEEVGVPVGSKCDENVDDTTCASD